MDILRDGRRQQMNFVRTRQDCESGNMAETTAMRIIVVGITVFGVFGIGARRRRVILFAGVTELPDHGRSDDQQTHCACQKI